MFSGLLTTCIDKDPTSRSVAKRPSVAKPSGFLSELSSCVEEVGTGPGALPRRLVTYLYTETTSDTAT